MSESATVTETRIGRPTLYEPEIVDRICKTIASGVSLKAVSLMDWAPCEDTIYEWRVRHPEFSECLARARRMSADHLADQCIPLVDGVETDSDYGAARVSKAREQVGIRRWLASCLDRDTYGERPPQVNVQVNPTVVAAFGSMSRVQGE